MSWGGEIGGGRGVMERGRGWEVGGGGFGVVGWCVGGVFGLGLGIGFRGLDSHSLSDIKGESSITPIDFSAPRFRYGDGMELMV